MTEGLSALLHEAADVVDPPHGGFDLAFNRGRRLRRRDVAVRLAALPLLVLFAVAVVATSEERPDRVDTVDERTSTTTTTTTVGAPLPGSSSAPTSMLPSVATSLLPGVLGPRPEAPPGPPAPATIDRVAFGDHGGVWTMRADGTDRRNVSTASGMLFAWSPDQRTLLVSHDNALTAVDIATDARRTIVADAFVAGADYTPDGRRILYWTIDTEMRPLDDSSPHHIWVANADGTEARRLPVQGNQPTWSPDGTRILFTACEATDGGLCTMTPEGTEVTPWPGPPRLFHARWSPDGRWVAGIGDDGLLLVGEGGTRTLVPGVSPSQLAWTADSASIIYRDQGLVRVLLSSGDRYRLTEGVGVYPVTPWR